MDKKERLAIYDKIRWIAKRLESFSIMDCLGSDDKSVGYKYFGQHLSGDWQTCLDRMVKLGSLSTNGKGRYFMKPLRLRR